MIDLLLATTEPDMLDKILAWLENYGAVVAIAISWLVFFVTYYMKRRAFREKRFVRQVNVSLNLIEDNKLLLRTLAEDTADSVWKNEVAVDSILKAVEKTTVDNPFVVLTDSSDQEWVKKAVLNYLSDKFADSFIAKAVGRQTSEREFIFAITCEKYGDTPTQKIRIMLVPADILNQFPIKDGSLNLEAEHHKNRIRTLNKLASVVKTNRSKVYGRIVLSFA